MTVIVMLAGVPGPRKSLGVSVATSTRPRPAGYRHWTGCLHLRPDPPPDLVSFGDDGILVHREDFAIAHDELAVNHHRLDIGRLPVVDPGGHDAPCRHQV